MGVKNRFHIVIWFVLVVLPFSGVRGQKHNLPVILTEASGLVVMSDTAYWINDGGNPAQIISTDLKGRYIETYDLLLQNTDWESLDTDSEGHFYIADIGNNANKRKNFTIFRWNKSNGAIEQTGFEYGNQRKFPPPEHEMIFDSEAILVYRDTISLFSKNRLGSKSRKIYLYQFPFLKDSIQKITPKDSLDISDWLITGAAMHPSKKIVVLIGYRYSYGLAGIFPSSELSATFLYDFPEGQFFRGRTYTKRLPTWFYALQYEAVDWVDEGSFVVGSEQTLFVGPKIRKFKLTNKDRKILNLD